MMINKKSRIPFRLTWLLLFCIAQILPGTRALAAFLDPYWSSRVASLGGAFTAVSDDATGVFYNPAAAVGKIIGKEANFSYAKLFTGLSGVNLSLNELAYAQSVGKSSLLGVGWGNFTAADLYREDTILVSLARSIEGWIPGYQGKLSVGVSGKYLMRGYILNDRSNRDPVFANGSRNHAGTMDLHAYAAPAPNLLPGLSLGVTVRSVTQPNVTFQEQIKQPIEIVTGIAYRWKNVLLPIDVSSRNGKLEPRFGSEIYLKDERIALRFGGDLYQVGMGFGYRHALTQRFTVVLDYAFIMPLEIENTSGSHRATLGLKF